MSTIYVNGRFLIRPMSGVERYAYRVCKAMVSLGHKITLVCPKAPIHSCYDVSDFSIVYFGYGSSHIWEQFVLPFFFFRKKDYLLLNFMGLGPVAVCSKVMTIHDLSFLENPRWFSKAYYWWYKLMTPLAVRTSKHVLTVSRFSKSEILRFYSFVKSDDVTVAYGAADEAFQPDPSIRPSAEPFALAVSSLDPRKNFSSLISAFQGVNGCQLYIVGTYNRVFTAGDVCSRQLPSVKFLGRVTDGELIRLYNQASCFVFPSVYEGFGLPPIEAMHCGCPVLASDIPVLREVCGDAAVYFNPYDIGSIRNAINQFFEKHSECRTVMQAKGFENVKRFSWELTANVIVGICNTLSNKKA